MTNIYKVTLYYYYGDARPEPKTSLYVSCDHKPSLKELENNEIIQKEMANNHCEYIDVTELIIEGKVNNLPIIHL